LPLHSLSALLGQPSHLIIGLVAGCQTARANKKLSWV
jgi:hypothetical protein